MDGRYTFPQQSSEMPSQRKCAFCHLPGHCINHCDDSSAVELVNTANFKSNIALQYLGTGAEEQMFQEVKSWFKARKVTELRVLSYSKGISPVGPKYRLVAIALLAYYFRGQERPGPVFEGRRYLTSRFMRRRYLCGCVASGEMDQALADQIFEIDMERVDPSEQWTLSDDEDDYQEWDDEKPGPEDIPFIDGLTEESADCPICFETETNIAKTNCGHLFCRPCIMTHTKGVTAVPCPCCRTAIDLFIVK